MRDWWSAPTMNLMCWKAGGRCAGPASIRLDDSSHPLLPLQSVFFNPSPRDCLDGHPMRAIEITKPGAPDVLQICERPMPIAKAGEVIIKVHAAGINRPDVLQRTGNYPVPPGASDLPGLEVAGEIVDGELAGSGFSKGDMVCALVQGGGYAEYCAAPIAQCLPVPKGLSAVEAASLPETFFTVWSNVFDRARLAEGETLLVQGGSSCIGVTAIQLASAMGHRVFATAGSDDKCRACVDLGAEKGINYRSEDFVDVVKAATDGRGVDVVLDMVAGDYLPREINCLADDGRIVIIALLGGAKAAINLGDVLRRRLTITGSTLRPRPVAFKAAIAGKLKEKVWPLLEAGKVKPVIFKTFPLEQAAEAHALMESSTHVGKIVLEVV
jgi:NADPH2:quinone reductase